MTIIKNNQDKIYITLQNGSDPLMQRITRKTPSGQRQVQLVLKYIYIENLDCLVSVRITNKRLFIGCTGPSPDFDHLIASIR